MKIPGSFFEAKLVRKDAMIEFQIINGNVIKYKASIMDFSEVEYDLPEILEENGIILPKNRLGNILQDLEAKYLQLFEEQQTFQKKQIARNKASTQAILESNTSKGSGQKVLITGGKGKSSIFQVIFRGKLPHETRNLPPTVKTLVHNIDIPSITSSNRRQSLNFWETGSEFPDDDAFKDASILLFIIDGYDVSNYEIIRENLHKAYSSLVKLGNRPAHLLSYQSNFFCFIHKMDLFPNAQDSYESLVNYFKINPETGAENKKIVFFPTSIFDSTIYSAWTKVIEVMMPKSSKLNQLCTQLKEDLGLYATLVIEKRTGLPICASKTLLDDSALVGSTNRVLITIEKVLPEFQLAGLNGFSILTATGNLTIKLFDKYFIIVLLYPGHITINDSGSKSRISEFIDNMRTNI